MQTIKSVRLLVTSRDLATHHVPWAYKETYDTGKKLVKRIRLFFLTKRWF